MTDHADIVARLDRLEETLTTAHEHVEAKIVQVIDDHRENDHYPITFDQIESQLSRATERDDTMERIITLLEGEVVRDLSGNETGREGGVVELIEIIEHRTNGGVVVTQNVEWSKPVKAAIVVSAVGVFFAALPGFWIAIQWAADVISRI